MIEAISPCVDGGRFPIKRVAGDTVTVEADIFADGHDELLCRLLYRGPDGRRKKVAMEALGNDRWRASFPVDTVGRYRYTIEAWVDRFVTWVHALRKRVDAGQNVTVDLQIGSGLVLAAAERTRGRLSRRLRDWSERLDATNAFDPELEELMGENADR
ncbi:MAG TPA: maltotransferase domain-containing protein, partial [Candidatus Dormibacteraeota bacterium]|nr:maltotransferase domain-containing protein [Candidatus Dormibacteraeota bacterium]